MLYQNCLGDVWLDLIETADNVIRLNLNVAKSWLAQLELDDIAFFQLSPTHLKQREIS